jgi:putative transposase
LDCPWQRCTVHFLRETLGHVRKDQQGMVAALLRPIFNADDRDAARELVDDALERLGKPLPKVAALLEEAEEDLLAFYSFPPTHRPKLRSTNPLERVNREVGRRTDVVGIFLRVFLLRGAVVSTASGAVGDSESSCRACLL